MLFTIQYTSLFSAKNVIHYDPIFNDKTNMAGFLWRILYAIVWKGFKMYFRMKTIWDGVFLRHHDIARGVFQEKYANFSFKNLFKSRSQKSKVNSSSIIKKNPFVIFSFLGVGFFSYIAVKEAIQNSFCQSVVAESLWVISYPRILFRDGIFASTSCGFDLSQSIDL